MSAAQWPPSDPFVHDSTFKNMRRRGKKKTGTGWKCPYPEITRDLWKRHRSGTETVDLHFPQAGRRACTCWTWAKACQRFSSPEGCLGWGAPCSINYHWRSLTCHPAPPISEGYMWFYSSVGGERASLVETYETTGHVNGSMTSPSPALLQYYKPPLPLQKDG